MPGGAGNGDMILVGSLWLNNSVLKQNVDTANALLDSIGKNSKTQVAQMSQLYTNFAKSVGQLATAANTAQNALNKTGSGKVLHDATTAYRELNKAQSEYMIAMNTGNQQQQKYWSDRNASLTKTIANLKTQATAISDTDKNYRVIMDTIQRMENHVDSFNKKQQQMAMPDYLKKAKSAYSDLTNAQSQ